MTHRNFLRLAAQAVLFAALLLKSTTAQQPVDARQMLAGTRRPAVAVKTFENSEKLLPVGQVNRGGPVRKLPPAKVPLQNVHFEVAGKHYDLFDYLALNRVAGILILKDGAVFYEDYELGTGPETHWPSFSMAKSAASTLVGAALEDGSIASLDDPGSQYLPSMKGGPHA